MDKEQEMWASKVLSDRQLPDWCEPEKNVTNDNDPPLPQPELEAQDSEFTLTEYEKQILSEDPTFVYPLPAPIPPSPYWSDRLLNDVIIDEVDNPNEFYIRNFETRNELSVLEDAMYEYYQANWKVSRIMTMEEIEMKGFYAVYSFRTEGWHRAKVMEPVWRDDGRRREELLIFMVDHGKTDIVTLECIAFLRKHYVELPIQAAWAGLDVPGIDMVQDWDAETITSFTKDVEGKTFGAIIKKVGASDEKYMSRVKVVLREIVDGEEKIYTFGGRLAAAMIPKNG